MAGVIVLDRQVESLTYTKEDLEEYAVWLGMDLEEDHEYLWIARAGMECKLPSEWLVCLTETGGDVFFFNNLTGASVWEHPCDDYYKNLFKEEKAQNAPRLVGIVSASEFPSGTAEIHVTSISGDELITLQTSNPSETVQTLISRITKELGQVVRLMLPNGTLLASLHKGTKISNLFDISIVGEEMPDERPSEAKIPANTKTKVPEPHFLRRVDTSRFLSCPPAINGTRTMA